MIFSNQSSFFTMPANGWQYAEGGISKLQLIKPLHFLLNVQKFKLPTTPGLRILRVSHWHFMISSFQFHK